MYILVPNIAKNMGAAIVLSITKQVGLSVRERCLDVKNVKIHLLCHTQRMLFFLPVNNFFLLVKHLSFHSETL